MLRLIAASVAVLIVSCGGGGGSGPAPTSPVADDPNPFDVTGELPPTVVQPRPDDVDSLPEPMPDPDPALGGLSRELAALGFEPARSFDRRNGEFGDIDLYAETNNSALLQGPVVGSGRSLNATLSRSLPLLVETTDPAIEVIAAYLTTGGPRPSVVIVVRNAGATYRCRQLVSGLRALRQDGSFVPDSALNLASGGRWTADGSVGGRVGSARVTSTCLAPSESVYLTFRLADGTDPDEIAAISVSNASYLESSELAQEPVEAVVPIEYSLRDEGGVRVLLENRGANRIFVKSIATVLLNADGLPIGTHYSSFTDEDGTQPGQSSFGMSSLDDLEGSSTLLRFLVDFDPEDARE